MLQDNRIGVLRNRKNLMNIPSWYSIEYFELASGNPYYVRALRRMQTLRTIQYEGRRAPRSVKNVIFIWRLVSKLKCEKREKYMLAAENKSLRFELMKAKASQSTNEELKNR